MENNMNEQYKIKKTKEGIEVFSRNKRGVYKRTNSVKFSELMSRINEGEWDNTPQLISEMIHVWRYSKCNKHIYDELLFRRILISLVFCIEQKNKNGTVTVDSPDGKIDKIIYRNENGLVPISPKEVRLSMSSHLEGEIIKRYGETMWMNYSIALYEDMMGDHGYLSIFGWKTINDLHDKLIEYMMNPEKFIDNNTELQQKIRQIH